MTGPKKVSWLLAVWATAVIVIGGALASYHQPFQAPSSRILTLIDQPQTRQWKAVHILSGSCQCSHRVMLHLLDRHPSSALNEQIVLIDGEEPSLPDTAAVLSQLSLEGFHVTHIAAKDLPQDIGLHGVPLLLIASPENKISYLGGYGPRGNQDVAILEQIQSGKQPNAIPVLGCAIGNRLRRQADPFHIKY